MSQRVIPAPARFTGGEGQFAVRSGATVAYTGTALAPIVERFCSQITRRTGLRPAPMAGSPEPDQPSVRIELVAGSELDGLPAPLGLSPAGDTPADERHSLAIETGRVVLRAARPVGVARGLTTLLQLLAAAPDGNASEISVSTARILDAPRYAWRGLSLDLARTFFTPGEIRRVIDLLALYKLNVLHTHLTDDQNWRLPAGRPEDRSPTAPPTAPKTCARSSATPRTASSPSSPRSIRPGTLLPSCRCTRG